MKPDDLVHRLTYNGDVVAFKMGRRRGNQSLESVGDVRTQFAMRVIWRILGAACAALAGVLFTILLK